MDYQLSSDESLDAPWEGGLPPITGLPKLNMLGAAAAVDPFGFFPSARKLQTSTWKRQTDGTASTTQTRTTDRKKTGTASCREGGWISVVAVPFKKETYRSRSGEDK